MIRISGSRGKPVLTCHGYAMQHTKNQLVKCISSNSVFELSVLRLRHWSGGTRQLVPDGKHHDWAGDAPAARPKSLVPRRPACRDEDQQSRLVGLELSLPLITARWQVDLWRCCHLFQAPNPGNQSVARLAEYGSSRRLR